MVAILLLGAAGEVFALNVKNFTSRFHVLFRRRSDRSRGLFLLGFRRRWVRWSCQLWTYIKTLYMIKSLILNKTRWQKTIANINQHMLQLCYSRIEPRICAFLNFFTGTFFVQIPNCKRSFGESVHFRLVKLSPFPKISEFWKIVLTCVRSHHYHLWYQSSYSYHLLNVFSDFD